MTTSTQCPQCGTRFKVTPAQLEAHRGLVRCGRCQTVFNAAERLQQESGAEPAVPDAQPAAPAPPPAPADDGIFILPPDDSAPLPEKRKRQPAWPWALGSILLAFVLLAQAAYFYRIDLAALHPGLKPALTAYCRLLQCTVPLPRKAELVSIESSSLETDPSRPNVIRLEALLRNRAPYAQTYPELELTLTDSQDRPLARRIFHPADYLQTGNDAQSGFPADREFGIELDLDIADLRAAGYRLLLFYPQQSTAKR